MSIVGATDGLYESLGLRSLEKEVRADEPEQLGLETFLKLMVTQLNNQDPMKPMENGEFLTQIAQFGSVTGIETLNKTVADLSASLTSGQALQAGYLVGRDVLVPTDAAAMTNSGSVRGRLDIPANTGGVTVRVEDSAGQLVRELDLGPAPAGPVDFKWDGLDEAGEHVDAGYYRVTAEMLAGQGGQSLPVQMYARVDSVSLGANGGGLTLNLEGLGAVAFDSVSQIY